MQFPNRRLFSQPLGLLLLASSLLSPSLLPHRAQALTPDGEGSRAQVASFQDADWNLIPYPDQNAPTQSRGGASRSGEWNLISYPDQGAPTQSRGGASRNGEWNLIPYPDQGTPSQSRGGASRNGEWNLIPYPDQGTPSQSRGGASRNGEWNLIPYPDQGTPAQSRGGTSRDGEWNLVPYPDQGIPAQSRGGSSRRTDLPQDMVTLMPEIGYGLTVSSHPTFFFYLPDSTAQAGLFRLKDAEGKVLYEQAIEQPNQAGIVAIALPEQLPELTVGNYYQWYVVLQSEGKFRPSSPFIDGWVQRVEPNPQVQQAEVGDSALGYAQALTHQNVWYDTLTTINTIRTTQPHSVEAQQQWQALLTSVSLDALVDAPVVVQGASH